MKTLTKKIAAAIMFIGIFFISGITTAQTVNYGIAPGHAYTVLGTYEQDGIEYVVLRNPWGKIEDMEEDEYSIIQQKMQQENRQYTTISNVMKMYYDSSKSTINNIR